MLLHQQFQDSFSECRKSFYLLGKKHLLSSHIQFVTKVNSLTNQSHYAKEFRYEEGQVPKEFYQTQMKPSRRVQVLLFICLDYELHVILATHGLATGVLDIIDSQPIPVL